MSIKILNENFSFFLLLCQNKFVVTLAISGNFHETFKFTSRMLQVPQASNKKLLQGDDSRFFTPGVTWEEVLYLKDDIKMFHFLKYRVIIHSQKLKLRAISNIYITCNLNMFVVQ
jgi:hypothetical protein